MKKIYTLLILLSMGITQICAQNPYCKWSEKTATDMVIILPDNINSNTEEGCNFRFELKDPLGTGWYPGDEIGITVDGVDYGVVTLPWMIPSNEVIKLLPSGVVQFSWIGDLILLSTVSKSIIHQTK